MKKTVLIVSTIIICAVLAGYGIYAPAAEKATGQPAGKEKTMSQKDAGAAKADSGAVAAKVNGTTISMADYKAEMDRFDKQVAMMGRGVDDKQMAQMKQQVINNMIARELLRQEAVRLGLKAEDAEVDKQINELKSKMGNPEEFSKAIEQMGMNEKTLRTQFASEMQIHKLIDKEVASKVELGPNDAKEFYDKNSENFKTPEMVRASHILVQVDKAATPEDKAKALEKMKGLEKKIKDGADFATVAKESSDCPSKAQGGDLNFFERGKMVPPFEQAAFSLKPGQMSGIVETDFGYHLIKVTDHKDPGTMNYDEIKPQIEAYLKRDKVSQQIMAYVDKLKAGAKIETMVKD